MPVTVEVPGAGTVEFPDGMKQEDMESALRERFSLKPKAPTEAEWRKTAGPGGTYLPASGEERAAREFESKRKAGISISEGHLSELNQSPARAINYVMGKAGELATGVANIPSRLANIGKPEAAQVPLLEPNVPKITIPQIEPEQMQGESKATQLAAGAYNKLAEFGTGLTTPGSAFTLAALPSGAARAVFGTQIAANLPGSIQESASILRDKNASLMEKGGAIIGPPAETWMLKTIVKSAPILPNAAKAAADAIGKSTLKKGLENAVSKRRSETLPVGEAPGNRPTVEQGVSQPEAPSQAQEAQAPVAQPVRLKGSAKNPWAMTKDELLAQGYHPTWNQGGELIQIVDPTGNEIAKPTAALTQQEQLHLDEAAKEVGRPVKVVSEDDLDPNNAPFAQSVRGKIATIDRGTGTILVNEKIFPEWLAKDVQKGKEQEAIHSLVEHEQIHLATPDEDALGYVGSLTGLEKQIGQRVYGGRYGEPLNDLHLGHEMLRTRIQQLSGTVMEALDRSTRERWTVKSLLAVGRAIQGIRETLGTKASKEGLAILDKVQGNLDAALEAKGAAPGAQRKRRETSAQDIMYLPPVTEPVERPTATEAGAQEVTTKKQLAPHAIGFDEAQGTAFRPITEAEAANPAELGKFLTEGARKGGATKNESITHRVTALFDKLTGRVEVVSTYPHGKEVRMGDPTLLSEDRARPHRPLERLLDRYTPIYSIYLTDPVQNFHERFGSMEQFQQEFALPARELAGQKIGSEVGEAPTPFARPTHAEAPEVDDVGALHASTREFKSASSPEKFREAIARKPMLFSRKALYALDSLVTREMVANPDLSAEQAIDAAFNQIYENQRQSSSHKDFTERTLASFQAQPSATAGPAQAIAQQPQAASSARELTMPIARRPPTDIRAENVPPGSMAEKQPAPAVPEGTIEGATSQGQEVPEPPAATRKVLTASRDKTMAEVERVKTAVGALLKRHDIKDAIPATLDAADTMANVTADEAGLRVAMASGAKGGGLKGADDPLNAIHTAIASHAIISDYNLSTAGPEARARFGELLRTDPSVLAARGMVKSDPVESARLIREAIQNAYQKLVNEKLLRADTAKYKWDEHARDGIDALIRKADKAQEKQKALLKVGTWREKAEARDMLKYIAKLRESAQWAKDNWADPEFRQGALQTKKELDQSFQQQVDNGRALRYDRDYLPGRYEDEFFSENHILFPGRRTLGLKSTEAKSFPNYFVAAENGYKAVTLNAANLVSHSVRQAQRQINYGRWLDTLKSVADPATNLPIAKDPEPTASGGMKSPSYDYELVPLKGGKFLAVHNGYVDLVKALTSESKVQEFPPARVALELAQRIKHTILVGDLFHLARVAYYGQAIAGARRLAGFHQGLAAIQFRPEDLPQAVRQGIVSQKAADWVLTKIPVKQGTKTFDLTRREIATKMMERGLNVGQIQDALYLDLTRGIPILGPAIQKYNRLLFNRITRGLMMESAVHEFERYNAARPDIDAGVLMRDVARDTNRFFGSIGRQGWFKSATWRDLSRLAFLAPQWVEGLVDKEAALPKRLIGAGLSSVGLPGGRKGLPKLGTLGAGVGSGLVAMLALTQAINLIFRKKPTWQNEEKEHKWDAWIPGGKNGFFLSPLAVFNELTHDMVRLFQSKPKAWDALQQIGENKLGPFGHMALVLATDKSPRGEYQTTSAGVMKEAGKAVLPVPISFGTVGREGLSRLAPGLVSPPPQGSAQRQMLQWVGLKAEPGQGAAQRISRMADEFAKASGKPATGFQFEPTDDPSYAKLRSVLRNGDTKTAREVMAQLEKGRPIQKIGQAMKLWASRPFTGSKKMESAFIGSLSNQDKELYSQARIERQKEYEAFLQFLQNR